MSLRLLPQDAYVEASMIPFWGTLGVAFICAVAYTASASRYTASGMRFVAIKELFLGTLCFAGVVLEGILAPLLAAFSVLWQHPWGALYFVAVAVVGRFLLVAAFSTWMAAGKMGVIRFWDWLVIMSVTLLVPLVLVRLVPAVWDGRMVISVSFP